MDGGTIVFEMLEAGKSGKRYSARGTIDKDGHYELTTFGFGDADGAAAGMHRVTIVPNTANAPDQIGVNVLDYSNVPKKYTDFNTSPLVKEVTAGENIIPIEIPAKGD